MEKKESSIFILFVQTQIFTVRSQPQGTASVFSGLISSMSSPPEKNFSGALFEHNLWRETRTSVAEIKELLSLFGSLDSNSSHPHYSAVSGVCVKARRSQSSPAQAKPLTPAIKEQLSTGGQSEGPQRWLPKVTFKSDCSACSADKRPL